MKSNRRQFLKTSVTAGLGVLASTITPTDIPSTPGLFDENLRGTYRPVHDPCVIKEDDTYYLFCTGKHIPIRTSPDLTTWTRAGDVFEAIPDWAKEQVPGVDSIWAPDISFFNGRYHLYYSISTFGSNNSCIALLTTPTLNPESPNYHWTDHGIVIRSTQSDNFNAIDPNICIDETGTPWLSFGSFWSGIKLVQIVTETGMPQQTDYLSLAARQTASGSVEAPFIIRHQGYYYLFVSFDFCCQGYDSTYRTMVGRAEKITGPYADREGTLMTAGGGTQITFPTGRWRGPGHNAVLQTEKQDFLVYHAYDMMLNATPTLRIQPLQWDDNNWPYIP